MYCTNEHKKRIWKKTLQDLIFQNLTEKSQPNTQLFGAVLRWSCGNAQNRFLSLSRALAREKINKQHNRLALGWNQNEIYIKTNSFWWINTAQVKSNQIFMHNFFYLRCGFQTVFFLLQFRCWRFPRLMLLNWSVILCEIWTWLHCTANYYALFINFRCCYTFIKLNLWPICYWPRLESLNWFGGTVETWKKQLFRMHFLQSINKNRKFEFELKHRNCFNVK